MRKDKLDEWNEIAAEAKAEKVRAMESAIRTRGRFRRGHLWFSRVFAWVERKAIEGRQDEVNNG